MVNLMHDERPIFEVLRNVVENYPVPYGDITDPGLVLNLENLGLAVLDKQGNWIPTAKGINSYESSWLHPDNSNYHGQ